MREMTNKGVNFKGEKEGEERKDEKRERLELREEGVGGVSEVQYGGRYIHTLC